MPYSKTTWANAPGTSSPLSAANLNNLETQYDQAIADCVNVSGDAMTGPLSINSATVPLTIGNTAAGGGPILQMTSNATGGAASTIMIARNLAPTNNKLWETIINNTTLIHRTLNDAYTIAYDWLSVWRTAGSHSIEHVDINAASYVAHGSPNTFVNNLYVQAGYVRNRTSAPVYELWSDNSAVNHQRWQFIATGNNMGIRAVNDAGGAGGNDIVFTRSGEQFTQTQFRSSGVPFAIMSHTTSQLSLSQQLIGTSVRLDTNTPHIRFRDNAGGAELKLWELHAVSGVIRLRTINDAENSYGPHYLDFTRSGNALAAMRFITNGVLTSHYDFANSQFRFARKGLITFSPQLADASNPTTGIMFHEFGEIMLLHGGQIAATAKGGVSASVVLDVPILGVGIENHSPAGTTTKRFPIYDNTGTFQGYVRVYSA